jgi:tetratricopeptide (TPR) repeat protein
MKNLKLILVSLVCYCSAFSQSPDSATILFQKGLEEKTARRYKEAFTHLRKVVSIKPEHLEAQKELGLVAIEIRQYEVAKSAFLKVHELNSTDNATIESLANLYFWTRKWDDAIKYGMKMQELKIGKRSNYIIGKSYYEQENYGACFRYLDAAFKEEPNNAEIPYLFARAFVEMSNYKMAAKYFQQAVALDSSNPRWYYEMAMTYSAIPDDKTAVQYYELALAKGHKMDNDFVENMANSYVLSGQGEKGIDLMKKLLEKRPADIVLLFNIADTYYRMKKYQEAIDHWDKILSYDKQNARSLYMIGMCYQKKGDKAKGEALCDKAIQMDPSLESLRQKKMNVGL